MYNKIVNPQTGRYVSVKGTIGKTILNNYLKQLGGATNETPKRAVSSGIDEEETLVFCHGNLYVEIYDDDNEPQDQELLDEILEKIDVDKATTIVKTIDKNALNYPDINNDLKTYISDLTTNDKHGLEKKKNYIFMNCPIDIPLSYFIINNAKILVITNFFDILDKLGIDTQLIKNYIDLKSDETKKLNLIEPPESIDGVEIKRYYKSLVEEATAKSYTADLEIDSISLDNFKLKLRLIFRKIKNFTRIEQTNYRRYLPKPRDDEVGFHVAPAKYGIITDAGPFPFNWPTTHEF